MNNLENLPDILFSPLSKDYCLYFYGLTIISFILLVLTVFLVVTKIIKMKGKDGLYTIMTVLPFPIIAYFQNRLFYSMCMN